MTKEFCDLCGKELYSCGELPRYRRFKIKELRCVENGFDPPTRRWIDIVAHNSCIEKILLGTRQQETRKEKNV